MGNRGNIGFQFDGIEDKRIYFYTHWKGSYIGDMLQNGIIAAANFGRLDDPAYATRIMIQGFLGEDVKPVGFGISPDIEDNEHTIFLVDYKNERVHFLDKTNHQFKSSVTYPQFLRINFKEREEHSLYLKENFDLFTEIEKCWPEEAEHHENLRSKNGKT